MYKVEKKRSSVRLCKEARLLSDIKPGDYILKTYQVEQYIGHGSFGVVFQGFNIRRPTHIAIKVENRTISRALLQEAEVLKKVGGKNYFCNLIHFEADRYQNYLMMDLLGPCLSEIQINYRTGISVKSAIKMSYDIITSLKELHSIGYVHRDIKPNNFCLSRRPIPGKRHVIVMIDFGRTVKVENSSPVRDLGALEYASLNVHQRKVVLPKDDIYAAFYTIAEMIQTKLPWEGLAESKMITKKTKTPPERFLRGMPAGFVEYFNKLEEEINYDGILKSLTDAAEDMDLDINSEFPSRILEVVKSVKKCCSRDHLGHYFKQRFSD